MKRILFANIGWMIRYQGQNASDTIYGGGSYRDDDKHESFNFQELNGWCYGYVQPVRWGKITLRNIDPDVSNDAESIDDVLVVWTAPRPDSKGTYIVGWYEHAVVYSTWQEIDAVERQNYGFNIKAKAKDCTLLRVDDRWFEVPRVRKGGNKGFMGQSNVWFANSDNPAVKAYRQEAVKYVVSSKSQKIAKRKNIKVDVDTKKKVEKAAVDLVKTSYSQRGFEVISVEKENLGWDLVATKGKLSLRIEVKGLAGEEISVHITPNEYSKMKAKDCSDYRLCVVTNALKLAILSTFVFDGKKWVCEEDSTLTLSFDEQIAAIAFVE